MTRRHAEGLECQWLSLEEVAELDFFKSSKRAKLKLPTLLGACPDTKEPGITAVVRREYAAGDVICEAGAYGSTAFLLLEGTATAALPERIEVPGVGGRTRRSLARLFESFRRRTRTAGIQLGSRRNARLYHMRAPASWLRNLGIRAGPGLAGQMQALFGYDAFAAAHA